MPDRIYKFGKFELRASVGELCTKDACVRLQEKPLQLLIVLLQNPQRLVARAQLRERMWDSETFVDYELGINVAIKKVRNALGDSAEDPRFIQTVAKKGYRFLVPVEVISPELTAAGSSAPDIVTNGPALPKATPSPKHPVLRRWLFAALATGVLSGLGLWLVGFRAQHHRPSQIHSLAVLPLRNLSGDPGQEYLADGITEELITDFAQSLPLRVISRTSVMRYKQTSQSITQIGQELGADAIVEGSVARSGNRVTVTIQLIDATEDGHLWAQKFERNLGDLLSLEAELSRQIASQVGVALSSQGVSVAAKSHPVDPQVYDLCLMARYHWNKRTAADLRKSAEYYQRAIGRDPTYASAYAGLANVEAVLPSYDTIDWPGAMAKAEQAARRAIELDDTLAEAHATLALIWLSDASSDWTKVQHEFLRAIELNPNYPTAHHWYAFYLLFSNRLDEAVAEMEVARRLDPLSAIVNADEGQFLYAMRRDDDAKVRLRQAVELAPDFAQPLETLALIDLETGHSADAIKEAHAGLAADPNNPRTMGEAGYVLAVSGQTEEARKVLVTLKSLVHRGSAQPLFAALVHVGLGQQDEALAALEEMTAGKVGATPYGLAQWRVLGKLQDDSRYQKFLAKVEQMRVSRSMSNGSTR
jgi:TolB-like protein/DNA-binding winged helix-turn-helix (wHTH) protein/tetratricopeptide (TPR) repeat protein